MFYNEYLQLENQKFYKHHVAVKCKLAGAFLFVLLDHSIL